MSTRLRDLMMRELPTLRHEPIDKRIRATLGGATVIDTSRALLVWEPRRVVPTYAVPAGDLDAEVVAGSAGETGEEIGVGAIAMPQLGDRPVLDPSIPFSVRTTEGEPLVVRRDGRSAEAVRAADPARDGYLLVDVDGVGEGVIADSQAPYLLFEPPIPPRYYLPREDVRMDLLTPSDKRTFCAYKGEASYLSAPGEPDVAWYYPAPLREAAEVTDRVAFFNELVDIDVDGERLERPVTPWSKR